VCRRNGQTDGWTDGWTMRTINGHRIVVGQLKPRWITASGVNNRNNDRKQASTHAERIAVRLDTVAFSIVTTL